MPSRQPGKRFRSERYFVPSAVWHILDGRIGRLFQFLGQGFETEVEGLLICGFADIRNNL
jgi:hypothetical protein